MSPIFTIGHSTRSTEQFLSLLHAHAIERVVDVRRFPGSRRYPHFSQRELAATLEAAGTAYAHAEPLGGRRPARPESPNMGWRDRAFRGYADYMATQEFRDALDDLITTSASIRTAIMCAEAVPWRCHRNLISDALVARGIEVRHILSEDRAEPHALSSHARVQPDGSLVYPGPESQLGLLD
jgi:uncharacterized protein (DUF488 family)